MADPFGSLGSVSVAVLADIGGLGPSLESGKAIAQKLGQQIGSLFSGEVGKAIGNIDVSKLGNSLKSFGESSKKIGATLTESITVPILGIGAAAVASSIKVDEGMDQIRTSTGATGEALKGLGNDFKTVLANVPNSVSEVASAIGDLSARTGLTGKALQDLATQELNLARLTKTDVGEAVASTTRVFGDWGIATADQSKTLDTLFKISQQTGIGVSQLSRSVVQFGAPLRQMGFDFQTSAALLGKFEKEGVNAELVMGSLRIALTKMAREGVTDAKAGLEQIVAQIKAAGTASQANAIAVEKFGAKAGPDMAAAIREGRFAIADLIKSVSDSSETINKAAADTLSFNEKLTQFGNKLATALAPLGDVLLKAVEAWLPTAEKGIGVLANLIQKFTELPGWIQGVALAGAGLAAAAGPTLFGIGLIASSVGNAILGLSKLPAAINAATTAIGGMQFATTALSFALNAIPWVVIAGSILYLATATWKWYDATKAQNAALADAASADERLAAKLKERGVIVDRGTKSQEEYHKALREAADALAWFESKTKASTVTQKDHGAAVTSAGQAISTTTKHIKDHGAAAGPAARQIEGVTKAEKDLQIAALALSTTTLPDWMLQMLHPEEIKPPSTDNPLFTINWKKANDDLTNLLEERRAAIARGDQAEADGIDREIKRRKEAQQKANDDMQRAIDDVRRSAGKIFDDMFIQGQNVLTSLRNALKGGALSLGRAMFEDVTGALLGPIKKAFDDFFTGLLQSSGISSFLNGIGARLGGILGGGGGGSVATAGGGILNAAGGGSGAIGSVGSGASAGVGLGGQILASSIGGAISGLGSFLGSMRLEGTMNAVEFNTRSTNIELRDTMTQILQPMQGNLQFMAENYTTREWFTGVVDHWGGAIVDAVHGITAPQLSTALSRIGNTVTPTTAGPTTIQIGAPVINVSMNPVINGARYTTLEIRDELIPEFMTVIKTGIRGVKQELAQEMLNVFSGITSGQAVTGI